VLGCTRGAPSVCPCEVSESCQCPLLPWRGTVAPIRNEVVSIARF
jgi:hypothetical protein